MSGAGLQAEKSLNFPRLSFEENTLTGVAIVNLSHQDAVVTLTAYDADGQWLKGAQNPVEITVPAGRQIALLMPELFSADLDPNTVA